MNPDFSQVETDASQVTVNERFALFYPEKRPFFLEGIELFATPNQLVYTRQIVDPTGGGKLTGKVGKTGVAVLSAADDTGDAHAWVTMARLRQDVGKDSLGGPDVHGPHGDRRVQPRGGRRRAHRVQEALLRARPGRRIVDGA